MLKHLLGLAALGALLLTAAPTQAQPPAAAAAFSAQPWIEDLAAMREAFRTKYANLPWLLEEREFDLDGAFNRAERLLAAARSDSDAVAILNRLVQRIADGHVALNWPRPPAPPAATPASAPSAPPTPADFCRARGYDSAQASPGLAPALTGYTALDADPVLPAGTFTARGTRYGILRIGVFSPHGFPSLCTDAVAALSVPLGRPCDEACEDAIVTHAYRRLTAAMIARLAALRAAGAEILLVDIIGNGGGSEWTEAAARMVTPRSLQSARMAFVRGAHWAGTWGRLEERLRGFAAAAPAGTERTRLLAWAAEAAAAKAEAGRRCPATGDSACPWLGHAGFSTGLVGRARQGEFSDQEWGPWIFNAGQHPYREGAWRGPVMILTDQETWSAAEQFAALLQDNRAALLVGARTGGAGCGHTWGGTPTRLPNSGATLTLPDCARLRADGSNEVSGVIPDVLLGWRANDGRAFRARMLEAALPEAGRRARALHAETR